VTISPTSAFKSGAMNTFAFTAARLRRIVWPNFVNVAECMCKACAEFRGPQGESKDRWITRREVDVTATGWEIGTKAEGLGDTKPVGLCVRERRVRDTDLRMEYEHDEGELITDLRRGYDVHRSTVSVNLASNSLTSSGRETRRLATNRGSRARQALITNGAVKRVTLHIV